MSFLAPLALALGALAAPIIMLYMLRLRRREVAVSSTLLWQQLLRDKEANSPWQRLRRNLLLILQLLILAALVLALARPYIEVPTFTAGRIALLIDGSASMNATDVNPSRLETAKTRAYELIDTLGASDTLSVIRVGAVPDILAAYTNDRAQLREAVGRVRPEASRADWNAALTLAAAGFAGAEKFSVVVIGDGGLPPGLPAIPGEIKFIPVGQSSANAAIAALAVADDPGSGPQIYAKLANYGTDPVDVILSLKLDDTLFNAQNHTIPPNNTINVTIPNLPKQFRRVEASLSRPAASTVPDYLSSDDVAYAVYNPASAGRALIMTPRNRFLEQIFASLPGWQAYRGDISLPLPAEPYDLYIFDSFLPSTLPNANVLIVNPLQSLSPFLALTGKTAEPIRGGTAVKDDLRVANVRFDNVNIREVKTVTASWATPLITNGTTPLLLAGEYNNHRVAILPFDLYDSDLPLQITWPILISNLTAWYKTPRAIDVPNGLQVGQTLPVRPLPEADSVRIRRPDGATTTLRPGQGSLIYAEATLPGIYAVEVYKGSDLIQQDAFAVNLFAPLESQIAPAASINIGNIAAAAAQTREIGQREYWPWIALIGLIVLVVEWWVYQRGARLPNFRRRAEAVRPRPRVS
jgi:Ca-activated chloride channel homolog